MWRVTCHMSHVKCNIYFYLFFFRQSGQTYRWRVCYQRGLPRLVLKLFDPKYLTSPLFKIQNLSECWFLFLLKISQQFYNALHSLILHCFNAPCQSTLAVNYYTALTEFKIPNWLIKYFDPTVVHWNVWTLSGHLTFFSGMHKGAHWTHGCFKEPHEFIPLDTL